MRVLIAHQSTIPHYRVRFYELVEELRPAHWSFDVVYDTRESSNPTIYKEAVDYRTFKFPILDAHTHSLAVRGRKLIWQSFFLKARKYDVLVTDTHLANLTYPALALYQLMGRKRVLWGHVRDMNTSGAGPLKRAVEAFKRRYIQSATAFLAYTPAGREELLGAGYPDHRITVLNNTIDIEAERARYLAEAPGRDSHRAARDWTHRKVLLHVGRLIPGKRIDFLLEAFEILYTQDPSWHLALVGGGPSESEAHALRDRLGTGNVTCLGPISDPAILSPLFTAADLFVLPGYVGLAPLQALCYQLPVVAFDLPTHSPEFEYLSPKNSRILPGQTTPAEFAATLPSILQDFQSPQKRTEAWESISHLTLGQMARQFIARINSLLPPGTTP